LPPPLKFTSMPLVLLLFVRLLLLLGRASATLDDEEDGEEEEEDGFEGMPVEVPLVAAVLLDPKFIGGGAYGYPFGRM